jgi:hypothetical protein
LVDIVVSDENLHDMSFLSRLAPHWV